MRRLAVLVVGITAAVGTLLPGKRQGPGDRAGSRLHARRHRERRAPVSIELRGMSRSRRRRDSRRRARPRPVSPGHVRYRPHRDHPDRHSGHGDAAARFFRSAGGAGRGLPAEHDRGPHRIGTAVLRGVGDPARGKALFEGKGQCTTCHRVYGRGPRLAPDLTEVGVTRPLPELHEALLDPSATMRPGNRPFQRGDHGRADDHGPAAESGQLLNPDARLERTARLASEDESPRARLHQERLRCPRIATRSRCRKWTTSSAISSR